MLIGHPEESATHFKENTAVAEETFQKRPVPLKPFSPPLKSALCAESEWSLDGFKLSTTARDGPLHKVLPGYTRKEKLIFSRTAKIDQTTANSLQVAETLN